MILDDILANKKTKLEIARRRFPQSQLERLAKDQPPAKDFAAALKGDGLRLIAEVKKASPSKGTIAENFDPVKTAETYAANGASAISVLTESKFFQGGLDVLDRIRRALGEAAPPLLRKDFLFDPYQIHESRAHGADAILLIVAILVPEQLHELIVLTRSLGMECLVEVHNQVEVEIALGSHARVVGINNRDLKTFKVDIMTTERLHKLVPSDRVVVSESGIKTRADVDMIRGWAVDAVLIGEALMSASDVGAKMKELL